MDTTEEYEEVKEFINVGDLRPGLRSVNLKVRCASKNEEREGYSKKTGDNYRVTEVLVGDETGSILLTLWNEAIDQMEIDKVYSLMNVYTSIFRNSLRLNIGKYGQMEEIDEENPSEVNEENNLSDEYYEQPRRSRPRYGGSSSYGGRPQRDNWKRSWTNRRRQRRY